MEARVDRGSALVEGVQAGALDFALTWGSLDNPDCQIIDARQIAWIGQEGFWLKPNEPLPLVAFDAPCAFRKAAISALELSAIEWRHVFASPSLAGVWAALTAGLGVTVRTVEGKPPHLRVLDPEQSGLPALGNIELALHTSRLEMEPAAMELKALLLEAAAFR